MRSYGQFCGLARALDVVGDRWNLLIVRELLIRPARFSDLLDGLPGIARNLLTDRLRNLEAHGVVTRRHRPPPVNAPLYELTARGRALYPVIAELTAWGVPLMVEGPGDDEFRSRWIVMIVELLYSESEVGGLAPLRVRFELDDDEDPVDVVVDESGVHGELAASVDADLAIRTDADHAVALLAGAIKVADLSATDAEITGTRDARARFSRLIARSGGAELLAGLRRSKV